MIRFSSSSADSDLAGDAGESALSFGESTSDKDDVPGECLIFLGGEGESIGLGVTDTVRNGLLRCDKLAFTFDFDICPIAILSFLRFGVLL